MLILTRRVGETLMIGDEVTAVGREPRLVDRSCDADHRTSFLPAPQLDALVRDVVGLEGGEAG